MLGLDIEGKRKLHRTLANTKKKDSPNESVSKFIIMCIVQGTAQEALDIKAGCPQSGIK